MLSLVIVGLFGMLCGVLIGWELHLTFGEKYPWL